MTRILSATCVLLAALCVVQWTTLRRLKADLALMNYGAAIMELAGRHDEVERVFAWIDARQRSASPQPQAFCPAGQPNIEAIASGSSQLYVYLRARRSGVSEAEARQQVVDATGNRADPR